MALHAYIFPGQGAQFTGMGKTLYDLNSKAREMFEQGNQILGFRITDLMFSGSAEDLKRTEVTQPAVFLHSVILAEALNITPDLTAGHSLGEFSALVAARALDFESGLKLVAKRASAMQRACEIEPGTMAAIIGLEDNVVEQTLNDMGKRVVAANYNSPGQLVISGAVEDVNEACARLKERGARRALVLPVGGAFHSPLMAPAGEELKQAIESTVFHNPVCPIFQNVDAMPHTDPEEIKQNLILQLTSPVRWTQTVRNITKGSEVVFTEVGPGKVLQGLVRKTDVRYEVESISDIETSNEGQPTY